MIAATALDRYHEALGRFPAPGSGCHTYQLSVANLGVRAGVPPDQLFLDMRKAIPPGTRRVPDGEIYDAIRKAVADHQGRPYTPRAQPPKPIIVDGQAALRRIIAQAHITNEADLWQASPIPLDGLPDDDAVLLLETLYQPADLLFIGDRDEKGILGQTIRPAAEWIQFFRSGGRTAPHIIPNPVDGIPRPKKTGDETTFRGDANISAFRFAIVEFDTLPREDQLRFWCAVKLPVAALIDTAGKSLHAWVDLNAMGSVTADEWETEVKYKLFTRLLVPMGADPACANPARLSRLPGHLRHERGAVQRILWLSDHGRYIQ